MSKVFAVILSLLILVIPCAAGSSISPASATLTSGQSVQFTVQGGKVLGWSITPRGVGVVNSKGRYTAPDAIPASQTVIVTAVMSAWKTASAIVTLKADASTAEVPTPTPTPTPDPVPTPVPDPTPTPTPDPTPTPTTQKTWYVRADGGTRTQCTGLADAPYPGEGTAQPCAFKHPAYALSNRSTWGIAGGDTLLIADGSYGTGAEDPDMLAVFNGVETYDFVFPVPPAGSAGSPTVIGGKNMQTGCATKPELWASQRSFAIFELGTAHDVTLACMELTDHSNCIKDHPDFPCNETGGFPLYGAWGRYGIQFSNYTADHITLQDVNIHGFAIEGIHGAASNMTLIRTRIAFNGKAGWNLDLGQEHISAYGTMTLIDSTVEWNGCGEDYKTKTLLPGSCWGQKSGGYGDGVSAYYHSAVWNITNSTFRYNVQEGLDLLYHTQAPYGRVTIDRSRFYGNAGNQLKVQGELYLTNNIIIGNCGYLSSLGMPRMVGHTTSFDHTYDEGDNCRASGSALVLRNTGPAHTIVEHNYIRGEGLQVIETGCPSGSSGPIVLACDTSSDFTIRNNIIDPGVSYLYLQPGNSGYSFPPSGKAYFLTQLASDFYGATLNLANNIWVGDSIMNPESPYTIPGACPDKPFGSNGICTEDPLIVNRTMNGDTIDAHLTSGSPAIDAAGTTYTNHDYANTARPVGAKSDIGPYEYLKP